MYLVMIIGCDIFCRFFLFKKIMETRRAGSGKSVRGSAGRSGGEKREIDDELQEENVK